MEECNEDNNEAGWFSFCLGGGSKRVMVRGSIEDGKKNNIRRRGWGIHLLLGSNLIGQMLRLPGPSAGLEWV
jgi:hypothetical protein